MKTRRIKPRPIVNALFFMAIGPIVWAVHFFLVYGPQAVICSTMARTNGAGSGGAFVTAFIGVVTLVMALPLAAAVWKTGRLARMLRLRENDPESAFAIQAFRLLAFLSLLGILFAGSASLIIEPCAQLR